MFQEFESLSCLQLYTVNKMTDSEEELHPNRVAQILTFKRLVAESKPTQERFVKVYIYDEPKEVKWYCDGFSEAHYAIIDTLKWLPVGTDGGEPEDQTLGRDWSWVVDALNDLHKEKL